MNKKFYTLLCLLGLTGYSNGARVNENDSVSNLNQESNSINLKNVGIGLAATTTGLLPVDALLHGITHRYLYPGIIEKPAKRDSLPQIEGVTWETYELNNGGSIVVRAPKENNGINSVWICFPGNGYDGVKAIDRAIFERKTNFTDPKKEIFIGIDYPGYGSGEWKWLNAPRLSKVADEVLNYTREKYPSAKINVYAHSIGGYPATSLLDKDDIENFCLHSPVRLDTVLLKSKFLTYALNWENLSYINNMFNKIPKRKTKCNVFIISGSHKNEHGEFLSLYDTLTKKDGKEIKEKLIDDPNGKLNLNCKIHRKDNHSSMINFFDTNDPDLKNYDILTGKAEGDK